MRVEIILTKKEDTYCNSVDTFNNLFLIDSNIVIDKTNRTFKYNEYEVKYSCTTEKINNEKERLFLIILDSIGQEEEKSLESLRIISRTIRRHVKESNIQFTENVIWDEVSQYYCKKGYPIVNEIENLMRKLIYLFIIRNVGSTWLSNSSPDEFRSKIKSNAQRSKVQTIEENILYEADFIQLSELLFTPYSTITVSELYTKIQKENDIAKLRGHLPKSNWQRYFELHIKFDKLDAEWSKLYSLRNMIAHNKLINKGDFENLQNLSQKIRTVLSEAIEKIQIVTVPKEEVPKVVSLVENTVRGRKYIFNRVKKYLELSNPERKCFLCDGIIENEQVSYEHVIPMIVLGEEGNSLWNIVMAHMSCTRYKASMMPSKELFNKLNIRNENLVKILENEGIDDDETAELEDFVNRKELWTIWERIRK